MGGQISSHGEQDIMYQGYHFFFIHKLGYLTTEIKVIKVSFLFPRLVTVDFHKTKYVTCVNVHTPVG